MNELEVSRGLASEQAQNLANGSIRASRRKEVRPRFQWSVLDQFERIQMIETQAFQLISEAGDLNKNTFNSTGQTGLRRAIHKFYPGGMRSLREKLEIRQPRSTDGYWQRPEAKDEIEQTARKIFESEGKLTLELLREHGKSGIVQAVVKIYPGMFAQLKKSLGYEEKHKPAGYWTAENIREEAIAFYKQEGKISPIHTRNIGRSDLRTAISTKYPGGWPQLRIDIGLVPTRVPDGYWTAENIKTAIFDFNREHGSLARKVMENAHKSGLFAAVTRFYPGGWKQLRQDLNIPAQPTNLPEKIDSDDANIQLKNLLGGKNE